MFRRAIATCAFLFGVGTILLHAEATPSKELVQYIAEARGHGLSFGEIRKAAIAAGWESTPVDEAIQLVEKQAPTVAAPPAFEMSHNANPVQAPSALANNMSSPATPGASTGSTVAGTPARAVQTRGVPEDYQIGAGDVLQISVWKEPEASVPSVVVRPDGRISMPLLKEVAVAGMTPREAEKEITDKLSDLIHAADVTIIVTTITSKKIYIVGAAKKEGPLSYTYRMTVMQAISEAGGLTDYAKRKKIYVLHTDNGKEYRLPFNYDEVIRGERMEQNIQLSPGDTVLIPH